MTKVSVVITNYKYDKYLRQCVDSVVNQTYKDIEIIIVDDFDEDRIKEPLDKINLPDNATRYFLSKHYGLAAAANYGFKKASGEYFMRLDADDFLHQNCIKEMVDFAKVSKDSAIVSEYFEYTPEKTTSKTQRTVPHGSCMLIKSLIFIRLGGYREDLKKQEDYEFYQRIKDYGVSRLSKPLWYYRKHGEQMSQNHNARMRVRHALKKKGSKKALIVIPARKNSKGVLDKNLQLVGGKSLVARSIDIAKAADIDAYIAVSTDSNDIADIAEDNHVKVIRRPAYLALDEVSTIPVTQHAYSYMKRKEWDSDIVISLQPTSPFTPSWSLRNAFYRLQDENLTSIVSMSYWQGTHPYRAYLAGEHDEQPAPLFPELAEAALQRQDRPKARRFTGGFYIRTKNTLIEWSGLGFALGSNWRGELVSDIAGVDIDSYIDLWEARAIAKECGV